MMWIKNSVDLGTNNCYKFGANIAVKIGANNG